MPDLFDRVQETTTTGGTGTITLGGAVVGYRTFASAMSVGTVTYYVIDNGQNEWEIGAGTLVTSGTLSRDTVLESSNSNALVNFSSGTKRVFCSAPTKVLLPNETGNSGKLLTTDGVTPSWTTTLNGMTIGNVTPGSGAFTTLSASSTVSGTGFSTYLASPPAIGSTTPGSGAFTTLSTTGNVTLGDASADTVTFNAATVTLNNSTTISAASTKTLTLNGGAGSNGLVLDASNNVGIGTSSPGAKLHVSGSGNVTQFISSTTGGTIRLGFDSTGSTYNWIESDSTVGMRFATANTERMRLDSSGNLLVGTTSIGYTSSNSTYYNPTAAYWINNHATGTASGTRYIGFGIATAEVGSITQNGTTGVLYNITSDQRLKTNVQPAESAIQSILDFPVDQFDWIADGTHQEFGAIAQKAHEVIPEMVSVPADPDEMWGIDWSKAVPRLIKTIQEMHEEIESLKQKVNA